MVVFINLGHAPNVIIVGNKLNHLGILQVTVIVTTFCVIKGTQAISPSQKLFVSEMNS